jgi:hypothetical protein
MTGGLAEPCYAISLISYAQARERGGFFAFAAVLVKALASLYDCRPHWGKVCPLSSDDVERLYPRCGQFHRICATFDPDGTFRSDWMERVGLVAPGK